MGNGVGGVSGGSWVGWRGGEFECGKGLVILIGAPAMVSGHVLFQLCPLLELFRTNGAGELARGTNVRDVRVEAVLRFERFAARFARRGRLLGMDPLHVGLQVVLVLQDRVAQGAAYGAGTGRTGARRRCHHRRSSRSLLLWLQLLLLLLLMVVLLLLLQQLIIMALHVAFKRGACFEGFRARLAHQHRPVDGPLMLLNR